MSSDYHASPATMARLVKGHVTRAEAANLVLHLQACEECLFAFQRKYRSDFEDLWSRLLGDLSDVELPKGGLRRDSQRRHEAEARAAKEGLKRLRDVSPEKRHLIVRNSWNFSSLAAVQLLLEEARGQWHRSPKWALYWAELALAAVEALPTGNYPLPLVADYTARVWSHLGNANRLCSDLATAESQLRTAAFWSEQGTRDALGLARLWRLEMCLARDQRQFSCAFSKAQKALDVYRRENNSFWSGWTEIGLGITKMYAYDHSGAAQCFEAVLEERSLTELGLAARKAAHHNLALALLECDRFEESWMQLKMARSLTDPSYHLFWKARLDWLEGRLLAKTGRPGGARALLNSVRAVFLNQDAFFDAALADLDLAKLALSQDKGPQAREHVERALPVFLKRGIQREANEATMLLCRSLLVR